MEKTDNFKGAKSKIKEVVNNILALNEYTLDFGIDDVEKAKEEMIEKPKTEPIPQPEPKKSLTPEQEEVIKLIDKAKQLSKRLFEEWNDKKVPVGAHKPEAIIKIDCSGLAEYLENESKEHFDELVEFCYPPSGNDRKKFVVFISELRDKGFFGKLPNNLIAKKLAPIVGLKVGTTTNYLSSKE